MMDEIRRENSVLLSEADETLRRCRLEKPDCLAGIRGIPGQICFAQAAMAVIPEFKRVLSLKTRQEMPSEK